MKLVSYPAVWYIEPTSFRCYKGVLTPDNKVLFNSKKMYRIYNSGKCKSIPIAFGSKGVFGNKEDAFYYQKNKLWGIYQGYKTSPNFRLACDKLVDAIGKCMDDRKFISKKILKDKDVKNLIEEALGRREEPDDVDV